MAQQMQQMEIGLKTEIKRQSGLKEWEEAKGVYANKHLLTAWKTMLTISGMEDKVEELVWDFVKSSKQPFWKKEKSGCFGIYSTIGEYTNKKGEKSLAHYTENGNYLGSVRNLGKEPVSYWGNFRITKERFELDLEKLAKAPLVQGALETCFVTLFEDGSFMLNPHHLREDSISEASSSEDEEPLSAVAKRITIRIKKQQKQ